MNLERPRVMGVINLTPDSFSDGGRFMSGGSVDLGAVSEAAQQMLEEGAAILDVGGESTRPGADAVTESEELARVMPVVERLVELDTIVSVDTCKAAVAKRALDAGVGLINDVTALRGVEMLDTLALSQAAVCLMHMRGTPGSMQDAPEYQDVVSEVGTFLDARARACRAVGIGADRVLLDPGIGFGKTLEHNLALLGSLNELSRFGYPLLIGVSRKRMLGTLTGRGVDERIGAGLGAALAAVRLGARVVRTHDVGVTVDALTVAEAVLDRCAARDRVETPTEN